MEWFKQLGHRNTCLFQLSVSVLKKNDYCKVSLAFPTGKVPFLIASPAGFFARSIAVSI